MAQYDVTLRDYWRILRKRKIIVIFATVMLGLTSYITALISKPEPRYKATSKVQYQKSQTAQEAYVNALGGGNDLELQQAIIKSYPMVERVAQRMGLLDTTKASEDKRIETILKLRPMISTEIEGPTNIISISVTNKDRFAARDMADAVAEEYVKYNFETRNQHLLNSRLFIKTQRDTVKARLKAAQERLKDFQERTQIMSVDTKTATTLSQLGNATSKLQGLENTRNSIDQLLEEYKKHGDVSESTLLSIPPDEAGGTFNQLGAQLRALDQERSRLLVNFTEQHPRVRELDSRKQVVLKNMLESLRIQRSTLSRMIDAQRGAVEDLKKQYSLLPQLGIQLSELVRNVTVQAKLLAFYEEQYQSSRIAQSGEVHEVTILQKALLPSAPLNPSTPATTAGVGTLLGLILGVVFAFIAETLDTSIGTIEDVEEYLQVPVVGIIPHIDVEDMKEAIARGGASVDDPEILERRLRLAAHFEPRSTLAESYRALRTNIQFANLEKGAKVISVTSASNQEGKSTTVANLAMTLAQAGNRVLLVDGDLRRPTIARIFGLDREPGITDVILGNYAWREVVRTVTDIMVGGLGMEDIMMTPGMDNLNIITSGALPPNPAEITDSRRMSEFIQEVKAAYDVVLVDSPPVLQATDATVLGTKVDGVLLVYKIGQVSRGAIRRAKLQLDNVKVAVLGIVINGLRAEVSEDFRDMRYYSYYSYGSEGDEKPGPLPVRVYKRALRRLSSLWGTAQRTLQPGIRAVRSRLGEDDEDGPDAEPEEEEFEEESDLPARILSTLLWLFLILFLAAGILWQLGYLNPPRRSRLPIPPVGTAPPPAVSSPSRSTSGVRPAAPRKTGESTHPGTAEAAPLPPKPRVRQPAAPRPVPSRTVSLRSCTPAQARWTLHVSSYKDPFSARQDVARYRKHGYPVRITQIHIPGRGLFYRVLVGRFSSKHAAARIARALKMAGLTGYAAILPLPGPKPPRALVRTPVHHEARPRPGSAPGLLAGEEP